ncbi:MAG: adenosine deaminase [Planctomycetes bacterium]|nr:adenosine deaminase [Planctomycetota bacterium]
MSGGGAGLPPDLAAVRALPKVDLHCHLDGAVRPATLLETARAGGVPLPADTVDALLPHVRVSPACRSLDDFLATFETFYPVLSVPGVMGRAARELLLDAADDGVVHVEARFCPDLQATPQRPAEDVVLEVLEGLARGSAESGVSYGAIVCAYRPFTVEANERMVDLALAFAGKGVVGVDLAGPESLPGAPFARALERAREGGLPVTIHAGEAAGPESVREALDVLGARRIGHGCAIARDEALLARVRDEAVPLECCVTSNLQTQAVASLDVHPFDAFRRAGLAVTLNTDDPAVSGVTLSDEYLLAARTWGLSLDDLRALALAAVDAAFLDDAARAALRRRVGAPS